MERALSELWERCVPRRARGALLREYPLRPELLAVTRVWRLTIRIAWSRRRARRRPSHACARWMRRRGGAAARVSTRWRRVACGCWPWPAPRRGAIFPQSAAGFDFQYLGLVAFADPLRESVPEAVRECRAAGIRVVMITGDYPATARAIAEQAGIDQRSRVMSGEETGGARRHRARAAAYATRRCLRAFRRRRNCASSQHSRRTAKWSP